MAKRRDTRRADRVAEWAVAVRLNNAAILFWCGDGAERRGSGWGRESQAFRFASREDAEKYATDGQLSARAIEYHVVRLPQPPRR